MKTTTLTGVILAALGVLLARVPAAWVRSFSIGLFGVSLMIFNKYLVAGGVGLGIDVVFVAVASQNLSRVVRALRKGAPARGASPSASAAPPPSPPMPLPSHLLPGANRPAASGPGYSAETTQLMAILNAALDSIASNRSATRDLLNVPRPRSPNAASTAEAPDASAPALPRPPHPPL